jgi:hypothetical protein
MEVAESAAGLLIYKESRFFSAQNVVQYILDGTIQKAQTCVFYHMTYDSIVMT